MSEKKKGLFGNLKTLDKRYLAFLRMHLCMTAMTEVLNIFISTFILKGGATATVPMVYNLIRYVSQPIFMFFAVICCRKSSPRASQRIGFFSFIICFIFIMIFGAKAAEMYYIVALLLSSAAGFYYVTYSYQIQEYTTNENRDAASGISYTLSYIISLVFPLFTGILLSLYSTGDFTGYRIMFAVLLGISCLGLAANFFLTPLKNSYNPEDRSLHIAGVAKNMLHESICRMVLVMTFFRGIRAASLTFFIDILIYSLAQNEFYNGISSTVGKGLAICAGLVYTVIVTKERRKWSIYFASLIVISTAIILFFNMTPVTLIIFSIINTGLSIFITEPSLNLYFYTIGTVKGLNGNAGEVHTVNECFLALGEGVGIVLMLVMELLFPQNTIASTITIILLAGSQLVCGYLVGKIQKMIDG